MRIVVFSSVSLWCIFSLWMIFYLAASGQVCKRSSTTKNTYGFWSFVHFCYIFYYLTLMSWKGKLFTTRWWRWMLLLFSHVGNVQAVPSFVSAAACRHIFNTTYPLKSLEWSLSFFLRMKTLLLLTHWGAPAKYKCSRFRLLWDR